MTEAIGKPPVEGLSEVAWARIERSVFLRLDRGDAVRAVTSLDERSARRAWRWIALPVAIAAAIALVLVTTHRTSQIASGDGPSRVVSGDAPSMVSFGDAHVSLDANSAVVLEHDRSGSPTVLLERGAAWFSVAPRGERPPFRVFAGDATVRVIGTRFHVARDGEQVSVAVDHGIVEVGFRGNVVRVGAGQAWTSDRSSEPAAAEPAPAPQPPDPSRPSMALPTAPSATHPGHPRPAAQPATPAASESEEQRFHELEAIEARDYKRAIDGYLVLSQGSGKWAANALFAAARIALDKHDARGKTFLEIYLKRFADGANAPDARYLLDQLRGEAP
jgi:hypothetical protein